MAAGLEQGRRELKVGAVHKAFLENAQMDLSGLRIGKQRLVSKKKKKSSLKKVILEEREERQLAPGEQGGAWAQDRRPGAFTGALSLDAPEFVPSAWALAAAAVAQGAGAPEGAAEAVLADSRAIVAAVRAGSHETGSALGDPGQHPKAPDAQEASEAAVPSLQSSPAPAEAAPAGPEPAPGGAVGEQAAAAAGAAEGAEGGPQAGRGARQGARQGAAGAGGRPGAGQPQAPAPVFVPSWLQGQAAEEPAAAEGADEELPVAQAWEQMKALQGEGRRAAEQKPRAPQPPRGADLEVRHYVHQVLSDELDEKVKLMLGELVRFQERAKERDPLKYAKQKRFCVGIREARRAIARNKAKCLILAPNLEASAAEGGLDDTVEDLIEAAREAEVPIVFALSRNRIGKALGKNIRLSIVSVLSAEGAHQQLKDALRITDDLRRQWVLRQMSQMTSEDAEEAQRRAAEKAQRDVERKLARERREAERKAEEERKRLEAKAAKEAEKARKAEERKAQIERRRAEKAARAAEAEAAGVDSKAEDDRRRAEDKAVEEERERARREAEERAARERRRIEAEIEAKEAAARAAAAGSDSDSDSDVDLPAGFNDSLF